MTSVHLRFTDIKKATPGAEAPEVGLSNSASPRGGSAEGRPCDQVGLVGRPLAKSQASVAHVAVEGDGAAEPLGHLALIDRVRSQRCDTIAHR